MKHITILGAALLASALGCGSSSSSDNSPCGQASGSIHAMVAKELGDLPADMPQQMKDQMKGGIDKAASSAVESCKSDKWPQEALDCLKTSGGDVACKEKLSDEQQEHLEAGMLKSMGMVGGRKD